MQKKLLVTKSKYNLANQYILSQVVKRFNKKDYEVIIKELPNNYLIIANLKIEEV